MNEPTQSPEPFRWNADEALKLLDNGWAIVLIKDGLGDVTALAVEPGKLDRGVRRWRDFSTHPETVEDMRREAFAGPNKYSGGGRTVAAALHCLTEKAVFHRLPDGKGGFYLPPPTTQE